MQTDTTIKLASAPIAAPLETATHKPVIVDASSEPASIWDRVFKVAKVALKAICATALFIVNSTFFCTGVLFSVIFPYEASLCLNRVQSVWMQLSLLATAITICGSFLAAHYTLSVGALFVGLEVGLNATTI